MAGPNDDISELDETFNQSEWSKGEFSRDFQELARAIRHGNRDEAEYRLDRLAAKIGPHAMSQVSAGRFTCLPGRDKALVA